MVIKLSSQKEPLLQFNIKKALDYESAVSKIEETSNKESLNLVILDINLGKSKDGKRRSGEVLGPLIRKHVPKAKILVFTSYSDNLIINSILKNFNPEGFLIKDSTTDHRVIQKVVLKILIGETYYCNTAVNVLLTTNKIKT